MKSSLIILFTSILLFVIAGNIYSQDTINLIDGRQIAATKIFDDTSSVMLRIEILKNGKTKQKEIDKLEIYSIDDNTGKNQKIIYRMDSALGYPLSIKEMGNYISGAREARKTYKAPWVTVGGLAVGGVTGYFVGFWALSSAVVYGTGMGIIGPKVKTTEGLSPDLAIEQHFVAGYQDYATRKKVKNAIFGTAIGVAFAGVALFLYNL
jgi:hypothetical protein